MTNFNKLLLFGALLLNILVSVNVYLNHYSHLFFTLWLLSLISLLLAGFVKKHYKLRKVDWHKLAILIFVGIFPLGIRSLLLNTSRIHGDDIVGAYLVDNMKLESFNLFSGFPQIASEWESQFASPFFLLQKMFFSFFGANLLTIKMSIFPYISLISIMLFLVTSKLFGGKIAFITIFLYSFLAINLYLETVGLWIVSGTAVFMVFFYFLLKNFKSAELSNALFVGITCGLCFLFYFTAYIALFIMTVVYFVCWIKSKKLSVLKTYLLAVAACSMVVSPFVIYSLKFNNYLFQRADQVALLTGSWSDVPTQIASGKNPLPFIGSNLRTSLLSLVQNGIGGHGGVDFGHLALFEPFTRYLLIFGLVISIYLFFKIKKYELLIIYSTVIFAFATMVFSIPPPAYHRFSLAFPFLSLIMSLPFYLLVKIKKIPVVTRYFLICLLLGIFATQNLMYFFQSVKKEKYYEPLEISEYINEHFPNRNLYVAAYPGYGFEKTYYFSRGKKAKKVEVGYHNGYLQNFNRDEKYVYIILFPETFNDSFKAADPKGIIVNLSEGYSLFVN